MVKCRQRADAVPGVCVSGIVRAAHFWKLFCLRGSKCSSQNANARTNHQSFSRQHRGAAAFQLSGFIFQLFVFLLFKIKHIFQSVFPKRPSGQLGNLPISPSAGISTSTVIQFSPGSDQNGRKAAPRWLLTHANEHFCAPQTARGPNRGPADGFPSEPEFTDEVI